MQNTILDQSRDRSHQVFHRLTSLYMPPDFVKQASAAQLCADPESPPHAFAYPLRRLWSIHTKAAAWTSALYFHEFKNELDPATAEMVQGNLKKAALYWHIDDLVEKLWQKMGADAKDETSKLPDGDFALCVATPLGKERNYPLRNKEEVKVAADWFAKYKDEFTFPDRQQIASKLLEKNAQHAAGLPGDVTEMLCRQAGFGLPTVDGVVDAWQKRATLLARKHPEFSAGAKAQAEVIAKSGLDIRDNGLLCKIAAAMDQFDRMTDLNKLYDDGGLERPEEVLFLVTEKQARDFQKEHTRTISGVVFEKAALADITLSSFRDWLGDDLAESVSVGGQLSVEKLAEILPVLPRPEANTFERMAQALGIPNVGRTKAASQRFTDAELAGLVDVYKLNCHAIASL